MEIGSSPFLIIPKDPGVKFVLPIPLILGCVGLEVFPFSPDLDGIFSQEDPLIAPLNQKLPWASSYFGFLSQLTKRQRKESPC